jgi:hypothetical protein
MPSASIEWRKWLFQTAAGIKPRAASRNGRIIFGVQAGTVYCLARTASSSGAASCRTGVIRRPADDRHRR